MRPTLRLLFALPLALAACHAAGSSEEPTPVSAPARPLASVVTQQVVVAPLNSLRESDPLGWAQQIPRSREFMRAFDDALEAELSARGLGTRWVFPAALVRAGRANPSYSVDPYTIAAAVLRSPDAVSGVRLADPLASQLRTMIALQESARSVLIPVELWFEVAPKRPILTPGDVEQHRKGVAVVRIALVDARLTEIRWIGEVRSDPSFAFSRELLTSLVAHTADLIAAP